ncbi:TPA: type I-F CRISPR-associated protein Csy1 [Providencia alcalifaciens]|uniref:type I-F CRISPR-associated protein Csy1 n=1 Tax=Providencia alcalifaciens TaxID=126385 RepID=UPI001CC7DF8F|nr:type I-F CRISPR-associated protein Csy1 [Providencia alcalifaciens]CAG9417175.1 CRISPR-associated protein Csy1 [Providencia alcalifaciens]
MLDPAITAFFTERKDGWLKKNIKASMSEGEIQALQHECDALFSLAQWLPNAAERIISRSFTTHPSTFTNPSTGIGKKNRKEGTYVTPINFNGDQKYDGLLRSGNVAALNIDSIGNAAELDVESFLRIKLQDGSLLIGHIENETEQAKLLFNGLNYSELRLQFLTIKTRTDENITNTRIKQVYFPVWQEDIEYHLLSPLTPSGVVFELRRRIDKIRFSEQTKALRELKKKGAYSEVGYKEIYDITTIGYGGTKPQNISVLNNQNAGKAHLLASLPPTVQQRGRRYPTHNFFSETLNPWQAKETLEAFHGLISLPKEQRNSRFVEYRDRRIQAYMDYILVMMWEVRREFEKNEARLPTALLKEQQIWLFPNQAREDSDVWLSEIIFSITQCFMQHYEKVMGKKPSS